jgi:hypothetical protein
MAPPFRYENPRGISKIAATLLTPEITGANIAGPLQRLDTALQSISLIS